MYSTSTADAFPVTYSFNTYRVRYHATLRSRITKSPNTLPRMAAIHVLLHMATESSMIAVFFAVTTTAFFPLSSDTDFTSKLPKKMGGPTSQSKSGVTATPRSSESALGSPSHTMAAAAESAEGAAAKFLSRTRRVTTTPFPKSCRAGPPWRRTESTSRGSSCSTNERGTSRSDAIAAMRAFWLLTSNSRSVIPGRISDCFRNRLLPLQVGPCHPGSQTQRQALA
mmetsp:Transcript_11823/g.28668  ORF Transcript_11823/g.28668 Transcript_11823/m.28668 type:complete len:225 (+) Transcript_11823:1018-1692(+)